ncbi:hypothetical protein CB1_016594009 [Camelus ferus]|nr:hypothetical protein CB1_016594009 [Camelus ferus]
MFTLLAKNPQSPGGEADDAELGRSSQDTQRTEEEPQEAVSPEARESVQVLEVIRPAWSRRQPGAGGPGDARAIRDTGELSQEHSTDDVGYSVSTTSSASVSLPEETGSFRPTYRGASAAFCIQLFCIDEKYEARRVLAPACLPRETACGVTLAELVVPSLPPSHIWGVFLKPQIPGPHSQGLQSTKSGSGPQDWAAQIWKAIPYSPCSPVRKAIPYSPCSPELAFGGDFGLRVLLVWSLLVASSGNSS